jgi:hypothetical protein
LSVNVKLLAMMAAAAALTAVTAASPAAAALAPAPDGQQHSSGTSFIRVENVRIDAQGGVTVDLSYMCKKGDQISQITASVTQDQGRLPVRVFGEGTGSASDCTGRPEPAEVLLNSSTDKQFAGEVPVDVIAIIKTQNDGYASDHRPVWPANKP